MGPRDRADEIVGVLDVRDPVAQRVVHRVLQGRGAAGDGNDLGAQQLHPEHVRRLPLDVGGPHIDHALQAEARTDRRRGHAVLTRAGLGDDPLLAHAPGEQDLAHAIVDLVGAGVVQLVALEIDLGAAEMLGDPFGEIERTRPAHIVGQILVQLVLEARVGLRGRIGLLDLENQRHQRFGDKPAAENAEMPLIVGAVLIAVGLRAHRHPGWLYIVVGPLNRKPVKGFPPPRETPGSGPGPCGRVRPPRRTIHRRWWRPMRGRPRSHYRR